MKTTDRSAAATLRAEATLLAVKHPKCSRCNAPNPKGLAVCACGARLETATEVRRETSIAVNEFVPWHAALLIRVGLWLRQLAKRIEG